MSSAAQKAPLRGDLTQGPILKTLLLFSIPTLFSSALQSLNGTVNAFWVGQLIGEDALAATANANVIMFLMSSAAFGLGMAGTVKIGQRYGARNLDGARRTFGTAVGFSFIVMLAIAIIGWIFAPELLDLLETPGAARQLALDYLRMLFVSMPIVMVSIILQMGLRGSGDARTPLIFMFVTLVLDAIFNPILITGWGPFPELGIAGSALAMVIAAVVAFILMVIYGYAKDLPLRLRGSELAYLIPDREELRYIISKGVPMGAQMMVMSAAGIILINLVNREGILTSAAYGAAMQLFTYIQMPAMAVGGAISAMAAQYMGANKWGEIGKLARAGSIVMLSMTAIVALALIALDKQALSLFLSTESPAMAIAQRIQLLASWNFVIFSVLMVYTSIMRAGGSVWLPLIILAISMYPIRLGFYYLTYDALGADAIWWSYPVGAFGGLIIGWYAYHFTGWRKRAEAESAIEAQEQAQTDGQPAGRFKPDL